ncbi:MAG: hypothetical protein WBP64_20815 [Nitrososphaeraceae archaeon]
MSNRASELIVLLVKLWLAGGSNTSELFTVATGLTLELLSRPNTEFGITKIKEKNMTNSGDNLMICIY